MKGYEVFVGHSEVFAISPNRWRWEIASLSSASLPPRESSDAFLLARSFLEVFLHLILLIAPKFAQCLPLVHILTDLFPIPGFIPDF